MINRAVHPSCGTRLEVAKSIMGYKFCYHPKFWRIHGNHTLVTELIKIYHHYGSNQFDQQRSNSLRQNC